MKTRPKLASVAITSSTVPNSYFSRKPERRWQKARARLEGKEGSVGL